MTSESDGYVTEVDYPNNYYPWLSPQQLGFAALARGLVAPGLDGRTTRVLELGCGAGFSANVIAAANPQLDYTAVDFMPTHIEDARDLALVAGTTNVAFIKASFEEIANNRDMGSFDFITLHGVYTWISAKNREHIVRIAREKLNSGGLLYVSYNSFPGWAPLIPIQQLFIDTSSAYPDMPILDRIAKCFRIYRQLAEAGALSITFNRTVVPHMLASEIARRNYIAHEYLNENWKIFHFSEVVADMAQAQLTYVASARLMDCVDELSLTEAQISLLDTVSDPIRRESMRDLIVNQFFRTDIYAKDVTPASPARLRGCWSDQRFALAVKGGSTCSELRAAMQKVDISAEDYEPILVALEPEALTLRELLAIPELAQRDWATLKRALIILVGYDACLPALPAENEGERKVRTDAFNSAVLERVCEGADLPYLSSPVTGSSIKVSQFEQFALLADRDSLGDRARFVWDMLRRNGKKLKSTDGREIAGDDENLAEVRDRLGKFDIETAPMFDRLKIGWLTKAQNRTADELNLSRVSPT